MKIKVKTLDEMRDMHTNTFVGYMGLKWVQLKCNSWIENHGHQSYPVDILGKIFDATKENDECYMVEYKYGDELCIQLRIEKEHCEKYTYNIILADEIFDI